MLTWYNDDNLIIEFSEIPQPRERIITPFTTKEQKEDIKKFPYICDNEVKVKVIYKKEVHEFTIQQGFKWDGASIPRCFWRLIGAPTDNTFLVASMVHDKLCNEKYLIDYNRYLSTLILEALLNVGGVCSIKRWAMKHSVDNFQKFQGWKKKKGK